MFLKSHGPPNYTVCLIWNFFLLFFPSVLLWLCPQLKVPPSFTNFFWSLFALKTHTGPDLPLHISNTIKELNYTLFLYSWSEVVYLLVIPKNWQKLWNKCLSFSVKSVASFPSMFIREHVIDLFCLVQSYPLISFLTADRYTERFCLHINTEICFSFFWISGLQGTLES